MGALNNLRIVQVMNQFTVKGKGKKRGGANLLQRMKQRGERSCHCRPALPVGLRFNFGTRGRPAGWWMAVGHRGVRLSDDAQMIAQVFWEEVDGFLGRLGKKGRLKLISELALGRHSKSPFSDEVRG